MQPQLSNFLSKLVGVRQTGREPWSFMARCPAHDDVKASLCAGIDEQGWVMLMCQAGCRRDRILESMQLKIGNIGPRTERRDSGRDRIVAVYDYFDENGVLLFQKLRYDPKGFSQRAPDGKGGWTKQLGGVRKVLYRLPDVIAATDWVFIVEGEKSADRLTELGLIATCSPGGAGKWNSTYAESLRGKHVCMLPDADDPGVAHMSVVWRSLVGVATSVQAIELPELRNKQDVVDYLEAGGSKDELIALAGAACERMANQILKLGRN